jgi:hypothetical protein
VTSLILSPQAAAELRALAAELGLPEAEVVARAVALVALLRGLVWIRGPMGGRE